MEKDHREIGPNPKANPLDTDQFATFLEEKGGPDARIVPLTPLERELLMKARKKERNEDLLTLFKERIKKLNNV